MTNLVQKYGHLIHSFELWLEHKIEDMLERKIDDKIGAYFEANPLKSEYYECRVNELARGEAIDAIKNVSLTCTES